MHLLLLLDCCHFKEASWRKIALGLQTYPAVVLAVFMLYLMHRYSIKLFYIISVSQVLQYWNLILSINYFGFTLSCDSCSHGSVTNGWHFSFFFSLYNWQNVLENLKQESWKQLWTVKTVKDKWGGSNQWVHCSFGHDDHQLSLWWMLKHCKAYRSHYITLRIQ